MALYRVRFARKATADLQSMMPELIARIVDACGALGADPYPAGKKMKRLAGVTPPTYRLRVGDYRALYEVNQSPREVRVLRVVHRSHLDRAMRALSTG